MTYPYQLTMRNPLLVAAVAVLLTGCANRPDAVYELANKTDANVGLLTQQLHQIASDSSELYGKRVDNIARQAHVTSAGRAKLDADLWLTKKVGDGDDLVVMNDLKESLKLFSDAAASVESADKARRDQLAAARVKIDEITEPLGKVTSALTALAKQESTQERAKIVVAFGKEVREDVKKQLDDGSSSSNAAKALIDKIKAASVPPTLTK